MDELTFTAPDGMSVRLLQYDFGGWPVIWSDPADPAEIADYDSDGPDSDWETLELTIGDQKEVVWIDERGTYWLSRHLIEDTAEALSDAAIQFAQRDVQAARAADFAHQMVEELEGSADEMPDDPDPNGPVMTLIRAAEGIRDSCIMQSRQIAAAWTQLLEAERGAGRGKPEPRCEGCDRPESECSADPCEDVRADRED